MQLFRLLIFTGCLCIGQTSYAQLSIRHLTGDYYLFTTWGKSGGTLFPANGMYMVTSAGAVLFDTPWDPQQVPALLDSIEKRHHQKVVLSISTHYHEDRTGSIDMLRSKGVKTYSSKLTLDLCRIHKEQQAQYYFTGDTTFTIGNHSFETYYPGKGHSADNIVIWCGDSRILYGGCFVKSTESPDLGNTADADVKAWDTSVRNVMAKYHPAYVIPGHFGGTNPRSLKHTLKLIRKAEKK